LPRFLSPATPAIQSLGSATEEGRVMNRSARPVISHLRKFASHGRTPADQLDLLLSNMRQRGALDGLLDFIYAAAQSEAAYDSISHVNSFVIMPTPCSADPSGPKCNHNYYAELGLTSPNEPDSSRSDRDQ